MFAKNQPPTEWNVVDASPLDLAKADVIRINSNECTLFFEQLKLRPSLYYVVRDLCKWNEIYETKNDFEICIDFWETRHAYKFIEASDKLARKAVFIKESDFYYMNKNLLKFCKFAVVYKVRVNSSIKVKDDKTELSGNNLIFDETYAKLKKKYLPWLETYMDLLNYVEKEVDIIPMYHVQLRKEGYYKTFDLHGDD